MNHYNHHRHHNLPPPPQPYLLNRHEANFVTPPHDLRFTEHPLPPPPPRVSPIINRQVHPNFHDYLSPTPPFVNHVDRFRGEFHDSSRLTEEFDLDPRFRFRNHNVIDMDRDRDRDELRAFDERRKRRSFDELRRDVVYDDWRSMNDFEREELLRHRIDKRRRIMDNLQRDEFLRHRIHDDDNGFNHRELNDFGVRDEFFCDRMDVDEQRIMNNGLIHREFIPGGSDFGVRDELFCDRIGVDERRIMNNGFNYSGNKDFDVRDELFRDRIGVDEGRIMNNGFNQGLYQREVLFRDGNDLIPGKVVDNGRRIRDENVPVNFVRHGDIYHSPVNYRGREIVAEERFPEFYEERVDRGLYVDRGRIERERVREDLGECYDSNPRKKSSFCRLQPTSTFRKRLDKTNSSPQKGKEIKAKSLSHNNRSSEKKVGTPVGLDVSCKSNGLVAKANVVIPSSSKVDGNENVGVSTLDSKIVSESPLKARRSKNRGNNSPVPKKEEKQSENQVRDSPILMKVGIRKIAEVPDNSPKSSSSGSSSLSGGGNTCCTASLEGEILSKDDKRVGDRKKRKAVNLISRLSTSVPTNLDTGLDVGKSFDSASGGCTPCTLGSLEIGCVETEPHISNLDDDLTKLIEKRSSESSDIDAKTDDGLGKKSEPLVVSVVDNEVKIDICRAHMNSQDSIAGTNFITFDVDASIVTENSASSAGSDVNEPHGLSPKCDIIAQLCRDNDSEPELRHSGDEMELVCSPTVDVSNSDILSTDCVKIATNSNVEVINDIQEQQCTAASSILVEDKASKRRKLSIGGNLALSSVKEDISSLDMERKGEIEVCNVDTKYHPCNSIKKRKIIPQDSVYIDTSESCDLCSSGLDLSNSFLPPKDVVGEATNSLLTVISVLGDSSKEEARHNDSHSSVEEIAQSSYMLASGCNRKDVDDLIGDGICLRNELVGLDSEVKIPKNYGNDVRNHTEDLNDVAFISDVESESIYTVDGNLATLSDSPFLCTEPTQEIMTSKPVMLDKPSMVNSLGVFSQVTSSCDISSPAIHPTSDDIICGDGNRSESLNSVGALISKSNVVCGGFEKNVKPINVTAPRKQPFMQKATSVPSKYAKKEVSIPSSVSRQFSWRNDLTHGKTVLSSSQASPVTTFPKKSSSTHGKTTLPSSQASSVSMFPKKSLSTIPAKPRTWHRTDSIAASNTIVKKPSSSVAPAQRPPYGKTLKVQGSSYIRKGNSLVRNPTSSTTALGPRAFSAPISQEKPIDINSSGKLKNSGLATSTELPDCLITKRYAPPGMPKLHPSPCVEKGSDCNTAYVGDCTSPLQVERIEGMENRVALEATETAFSPFRNPEFVLDQSLKDAGNLSDGFLQASNVNKLVYIKSKANQLIAASTPPELSPSRNPEIVLDRRLEDTGNLSDGVLQALNVNSVVYIKRKANQLIAAPTPPESTGLKIDKKSCLSSDTSYYKRRKNQLIRASSESNIQKMVTAADDSSNSRMQRAFNVYSGRSTSKALSRQVKSSKVSLVWKLGDVKSSDKGSEPLRSRQLLSHLLPWKRTTFRRSVWRASASSSSCSSLIKPRKLLSSRNQAVVYVRSGRGFSLRRSKVVSLAGSLKWSKSMEKRSKKVDEEAALAVAVSDSTTRQKPGAPGVSSEPGCRKLSSHKSVHGLKLHSGERIFRVGVFRYRMDPSRRTLQRIPDEEAPDSTTSKTENYARKPYMPKRLLIGSNEYIRIGNGNQLVRDPKRRTRILASEKVRWSLHTARLRLAKKRKFCQFFTRFGRCNKSEGKCPYIHDSSKISVCTKFLKGLCTDPSCILTHKVIPDRMPDCSFFLQGLCSNESCPYRHVNVNPKASICEGFLRGYCSEGSKCQKKHSYLCPEFEATGSCPQGSNCKLYHPKKGTSKKVKITEDQRNIRGRYFDPGLTAAIFEPNSDKDVVPRNSDVVSEGEDLGDYISLDVSDDEAGESIYPNREVTGLSEFVAPKSIGELSGGDLGEYMNIDDKSGENNQYLNREVMYLCEFDSLNYLSDDVDEVAKPVCISDTR